MDLEDLFAAVHHARVGHQVDEGALADLAEGQQLFGLFVVKGDHLRVVAFDREHAGPEVEVEDVERGEDDGYPEDGQPPPGQRVVVLLDAVVGVVQKVVLVRGRWIVIEVLLTHWSSPPSAVAVALSSPLSSSGRFRM